MKTNTTTTNTTMRKPRTKREILNDPRTAKEGAALWLEDDGCFDSRANNGRPLGWWCALANGWNFEGCSTVHAATLKGIGEEIARSVEGPTY